uniref:Uncharacterized protein n=1 Tax=Globodera rostochiensis TaxID=31243 RepID=A0A914GPB2_GLORO
MENVTMIRVSRAIDGNGAQIVKLSGEQLPIPQEPIPNKVIGFQGIVASYVDQTVMEFLQRIRRLFDSSETNMIITTSADQSPEDNADASSRQALAKWLLTAREDGHPKILLCGHYSGGMDGLKGTPKLTSVWAQKNAEADLQNKLDEQLVRIMVRQNVSAYFFDDKDLQELVKTAFPGQKIYSRCHFTQSVIPPPFNFPILMMEKPFTVKNFVYPVEQFGKRLQTVCYDVQIPLPDPNSAPSDLFGHLIAQNRLPLPFQKEVKAAFEKFVRDETRKFDAELATRRIEFALNGGGGGTSDDGEANGDANKAIFGGNSTEFDAQTIANTAVGGPLFEEQFQHVMRHASAAQLSLLVREESRMAEEMRALVRARNFEVERIKRACEDTLANSVGATEFDKHSYELSMLNEKLRQVSINYSNQIEALNERQRDEYRQLVRALYTNETDGVQQKESTLASSSSCFGFTTTAAAASPPVRPQPPSSSRLFKKSLSYDSKIAQHVTAALGTGGNVHQQTNQCRSESFTIYIGAQLKTMHNARILTSDRLVDLMMLNNDASGGIGIGIMTSAASTVEGMELERADNIGTAGMTATTLCHSQRLQLLMNLYRRDLACAILIVGGCDPLWHVKERTNFAQLCEQSVELHFESLERQLMKIEQDVRSANRDRRAACQRRRQQQRCRDENGGGGGGGGGSATTAAVSTASPSASMPLLLTAYDDDLVMHTAHGQQNGDNFGDENSLRPGDVYVTCHSNLSAVQVLCCSSCFPRGRRPFVGRAGHFLTAPVHRRVAQCHPIGAPFRCPSHHAAIAAG